MAKPNDGKWMYMHPLLKIIIREIVHSPKVGYNLGLIHHNSQLAEQLFDQLGYHPPENFWSHEESEALRQEIDLRDEHALKDLKRYAKYRGLETSGHTWKIVAALTAATEFMEFHLEDALKPIDGRKQPKSLGRKVLDLKFYLMKVVHLWSYLEVVSGREYSRTEVTQEIARRQLAGEAGVELSKFSFDISADEHVRSQKSADRHLSRVKKEYFSLLDAGGAKALSMDLKKKFNVYRNRKTIKYDWECSETEKENTPEWNKNIDLVLKRFWKPPQKR